MKMSRTLLTSGVFALLAMIYVPTPHRGYRLIFSSGDTSIAFFQLLVNIVFAALLGAILATIIPKLPWWAWRWITGIAVIALLFIGGVAWRNFTAAAADRARFDEEFADSQLAYHHPDAAKFTLRSAARNWRLAFRFDEAARVENRIKELDWRNDPIVSSTPQVPALKTEQSQTSSDAGPTVTPEDQSVKSVSSYATACGFATYAMKLREQELLNVEPQVLAPKDSQPAAERFPWKTNIVTTIFWVGEKQLHKRRLG